MDRPIARWTIGDTNKHGYECLELSVKSFINIYNADIVIAHNCDPEKLPKFDGIEIQLLDQRPFLETSHIAPVGVAWKLYPPRLDIERHEICIDNDIIFQEPIEHLFRFFKNDCTLMLEGQSRNYGRFEKYIPPKLKINSGIYGMPPRFDMERFIKVVAGSSWELNAKGEHAGNKTFDEQGIVAFALLNYPRYVTIPDKVVTNCERHLIEGKGLHFVGLNKRFYHEPYRLYRSKMTKLFI